MLLELKYFILEIKHVEVGKGTYYGTFDSFHRSCIQQIKTSFLVLD